MKKAQILSALALAFALGVVAPIATTANTVSAFTIEDTDKNVEGTATNAEVAAAAKAVPGLYPVYNSWVNLDSLTSGKNAVTASDDLATETEGSAKVSKDAKAIVDDLKATPFSVTTLDDIYTDNETYVAQIDVAVKAAEKVENYALVANYLQAIEDESDVNLRKAIAAINAKFKSSIPTNDDVTIKNYDTATIGSTGKTVKELVEAAVTNYTDLAGLVGEVDDAIEARDKYSTNFSNLSDAMKANGILTTEGRSALAKVLAETNPTITELMNILDNKQADGTALAAGVVYTNGNAAWAKVKEAVDAAATAQSFAGNYNYNLILNIAKALQDAVPVLDKTAPQIAQQLAGYNGVNEGTNKKVTLTTENVTVTGEFEDGVVMTVEKVERKVAAFGDRKTAMYDIKLMKDGKAYNFDGSAVVTIKFEGVDGSKAGVYYVKNDNTADFMKGAEIKGDVATFTTSHFSVYAIVEDAAAGLPNTGVISAAVEGNASTTVAMVAGIATALTAAGAGVVAYRNARRSVRK